MVAVVSTKEQLKEALINKAEEIIVVDAQLATDIGKFIERLSFATEEDYKNIVTIAGVSLIIGFTLLANLMAFGFLVGFKILIVPEIIMFIIFLIALAMKLNNLLKNNYEIIKEDEEGLLLRYKLS
ncbi:hypothetical protein Riv7116_1959 [Rivularia sp. PCC 7116]|uniref:hypothetical protein n=1 Tax=Rivularia sp. PCC 7116 TaxID=373994 RepID=UPI00029F4B24|nr:hypothetical protein [Rivularia sp. PCC 7116]AFY54498.1 hypothetical protein Riv7116_1959 [Rivularia sp. PCC 7116]